MSLHLLIVAMVSLSAAACYSVSDVIEQRKASEAPAETSLRIALLWHLAHQWIWWLGILVDLGGFALQVAALGLGDIVFVQPLLLTSLPMSLALGHRVGSHNLSRRDLLWSFMFVVALSVFLVVGDPGGGVATRPFAAWIVPFVVIGVATIWVMTVSHRLTEAKRSLALGLAAGMLFGVSSTLMKSFAHLIAKDGWRVLVHWEPYVLAGVVSLGFLIVQSAFQAGDLRTSLPAVGLAEPVGACVLGILLLHERLRTPNQFATVIVVAAVGLMAVSTVKLARSAARSSGSEAIGIVTDGPAG